MLPNHVDILCTLFAQAKNELLTHIEYIRGLTMKLNSCTILHYESQNENNNKLIFLNESLNDSLNDSIWLG